MGELNSYIGMKQLEKLDSLINKQRANAIIWDQKIKKETNLKSLIPIKNTKPNRWIYGVLAKNKTETIKKIREKGFYATGVHINNNIYSIFGNKTNLSGVNDFMNHFVALPCGWWFNLNK
jgi:dTDP-4-amino-4,6-dideoxygalactose transaminase